MDGLTLTLFLTAAFFGGLISGLSGFAMGIVVSGVWLHFIGPEQNAALVVLSGLVTQGSGIWRVRHSLSWRKSRTLHRRRRDRRPDRHDGIDDA